MSEDARTTIDDLLATYQRWPDGIHARIEIGPGTGRPDQQRTDLTTMAIDAARLLRSGRAVHWQPGDGTDYHYAVLTDDGQDYLVHLGPSASAMRLRTAINVGDYVRSTLPRGGWRGTRPLLEGLGYRTGVPLDKRYTLIDFDQAREAESRAKHLGHQPFEQRDAELGRQVRILVNGA